MSRYDEDGEEIVDAFDEIKARHRDAEWLITEVEWLRTRIRVLDQIIAKDRIQIGRFRKLVKAMTSEGDAETLRRVREQDDPELIALVLAVINEY